MKVFLFGLFFSVISTTISFGSDQAYFTNDGEWTNYHKRMNCSDFIKSYNKYINNNFEITKNNMEEYTVIMEELGFLSGFISGVNYTTGRNFIGISTANFENYVLNYCQKNPMKITTNAMLLLNKELSEEARKK